MQFGLNFIPALEGNLLVNLKATLKLAGWKLVACGNGVGGYSAYNVAGVTDLFLGSGWFVLKQPTITVGNPGYPGEREFLFTTVGTPSIRYARYDSSGYVTGGSTSVPPTATHDVLIPNTPLGNSSTFGFQCRQHIMAQNAAPYAWASAVIPNGGSFGGSTVVPRLGLIFDFCSPAIAGDPEPYIWGAPQTASANPYSFQSIAFDTAASVDNRFGFFTWYGAGTASEQVQSVIGGIWGYSSSHQASPNVVGVNLWNNTDEELPIFWTGNTQRSGMRHPKGVGSLMHWAGTSRAMGTTLSGKSRIVITDVTLPWDTSTDPYI